MCLSGLAIKSTNTFVLHVKLTSSLFVYWIDFDKYVSHSGGDKQFCSFEVHEKFHLSGSVSGCLPTGMDLKFTSKDERRRS